MKLKDYVYIDAYKQKNLGDDLFLHIMFKKYPETRFLLFGDAEYKGILKKYKDAFDKCNKIKEQKKKKDDDDDDDDEEDDRIIYIQNYYTTLEDFIDKLDKTFDNETVLYKFYLYIKDLYQNYLEALKLDLGKKDQKHIFDKISEYIHIFIEIGRAHV